MINLDKARQEKDRPADEFLEGLLDEQGPAAFRTLFEQMIRQVELPLPDLGAERLSWLQESRQLPAWADHARLDRAQLLFRDHGPKILLLLFYKSLPLLYTNAKGAEVLIRTGRLHAEQEGWNRFTRRIAETAQFLVWLMPPGSLNKGEAPGIAITQRVRLIHAAIRQTVGGPDWDEQLLGPPINQEDLLLTLLTFSIATIDGLTEAFRLDLDPELVEDFIHFWNVVGFLLGIKPAYLPQDSAEARSLLEQILSRHAEASAAGKTLTDAIIQFGSEHIPFGQLKLVPVEMIRFFIGPEKAAILGVSPSGGCLSTIFPAFLMRFFQLGERLEDKAGPVSSKLLDRLSALTVSGMVTYFDRFKQRPFIVPDVLLEAWKLQQF